MLGKVRNPTRQRLTLTPTTIRQLIAVGLLTTVFILLLLFNTPVIYPKEESHPKNPPTLIIPEPTATSSHVKIHLYASEVAYQRYVEKRKEKVGSNPERIDPWTGGRIYYYDYFLPTFSCPHTTQRIGRIGDGGKWTCGFDLYEKPNALSSRWSRNHQREYQGPCIVYSFGVAGESSYEAEFISRTDCEVYAFDASVNGTGPEISKDEPRVHFQKIFIGNANAENETTSTLGRLMNENGHTWIDFLKMDIEESEYPVLNQIMDEFEILPFGQLQVEVHGDHNGTYFPALYKLWERLEDVGLRAFKNEVNPYHCVGLQQRPFVVEYGFINIVGDHRLIR